MEDWINIEKKINDNWILRIATIDKNSVDPAQLTTLEGHNVYQARVCFSPFDPKLCSVRVILNLISYICIMSLVANIFNDIFDDSSYKQNYQKLMFI